ncbi:MAG: hypothetical protein AB2745_18180 [Candidatus Thiodiazotropha endolucinida]
MDRIIKSTFSSLLIKLSDESLLEADVIPYSSPIPCFGNPLTSTFATLGINPSNREFIDSNGVELTGQKRRFHTLSSLDINSWEEARSTHISKLISSCGNYFKRNPYDIWFNDLELILSRSNATYYGSDPNACHLDLVPYATSNKWSSLTNKQKNILLQHSGDTLANIVKASPIKYLILNGTSVVKIFEQFTNTKFTKRINTEWKLHRNNTSYVQGYSYTGEVDSISNTKLKKSITIFGFNHNIQSSFGVTKKVKSSISNWIMHQTN